MTHGLVTAGTVNAATNGEIQIGSTLILPSGGPWVIHTIFGLLTNDENTFTAGQYGQLRIDPPEGDIEPDPAPGEFPLVGAIGPTNSIDNKPVTNTAYFPVNWTAFGKAQVDLYFINRSLANEDKYAIAGFLFGKKRPDIIPAVHSSQVFSQLTSTGENELGTIQLSERADRIVSIHAVLILLVNTAKPLPYIASIRLDSNDIPISPAQFPCQFAFGANAASTDYSNIPQNAPPIPVDIPTVGGARITVYCNLHRGTTPGDVVCMVHLGYI